MAAESFGSFFCPRSPDRRDTILPTERGVPTVASVGTPLISEVPAKSYRSPTPMMGLPEGSGADLMNGDVCESCQVEWAEPTLPFYVPTATCSLQSTMNCGHAPPGGHRAVPMAVTVA